MGAEGFIRKITAIMSADVVGYSKLMGDDEAATVKTLAVYKNVMTVLINQHRGRVIDSPGDNMLTEFASVVDAVQCAVAIQKELKSRNAELPENRKMRFRIGINLGDVIEEKDHIFGDGVNIAARLETLADPGGICVSKTAFDHIETKLPLGYEFLGEQEVKNIKKPVGAYRVLMEPRITIASASMTEKRKSRNRIPIIVGAIAMLTLVVSASIWIFYVRQTPTQSEYSSAEKVDYSPHDKPSFAVLPFDNISKDPEMDYLCDGITETLIVTLSKIPDLFVISRNSTFLYKGRAIRIKEIADELGVQYVIEGSVQKSGERLRLSIQVIDALTDRHVLSEKFDRDIKDLFELQDEIILEILNSVEITRADIEKGKKYNVGGTDNLDAYLRYLEANYYLQTFTSEDALYKAKKNFEEAIYIDPNYAQAYMQLGRTYQSIGRVYSKGESRRENFGKGIQLAQKAIELDNDLSPAHLLLGISYLFDRKYEMAQSTIEKAMELDPSDSHAQSWMALCLIFYGKIEKSVYYSKKAIRLDPLIAAHYFRLSRAYFHLNRYEDALMALSKAKELTHSSVDHVPLYFAMINSGYGRDDEAQKYMKKVLEISPNFNLEARRRTLFYKNPAYADREINALRKAGAPEHPPSK